LGLLNTEYNILLKAGSRLGHKHNDETRKKKTKKNSGALKGENNPVFGQKPSGAGKPSQIFKQ